VTKPLIAEPDPFPRERVTELVKRFPAYARLALKVAREPRLSRARRAVLLAGAAYLVSPVDLVPGIIPVAGQLDDALAVLIALRTALAGLPPEVRARHLAVAGLSEELLAQDVATLRRTGAWLARRAARLTMSGVRASRDAASRMMAEALRVGRRPWKRSGT
jgi:uncharacterized membrane protein YkvA (DUF1232 family)